MIDRKNEKIITVSLMLSRYINGNSTSLRIEDEASRMLILNLELTDEDMLNLITNRTAYGTGGFYPTDKIGKLHQHKTVLLPCSGYDHDEEEKLAKKALCWEKDNPEWKIDKPIKWNGHCHNTKNKTFGVTARQYIEQEDD